MVVGLHAPRSTLQSLSLWKKVTGSNKDAHQHEGKENMKRMRWLVALLTVLSLFAAACSASDDDEETSTGDTTTTAAPADETDDTEAPADETDDTEAPAEEPMEEEMLVDFGVDEEVIRIGITADLSGVFSGLTTVIVDTYEAYFERVNENGGIAGRMVEIEVLDSVYDVATNVENYAELAEESDEGVVMIGNSTGSPHTATIMPDAVDDNMLVVPLSWYSGWVDQDYGGNAFELYTNYCIEGMNGVEFLTEQSEVANPTLAVISLPGEYGQDGATGAKIAAEALGLEIVYDGEAAIAGDDFTPVITQLVTASPDIVWITAAPSQLAQILGGAAAQGLTAQWGGTNPAYNGALLDTAVGPALDAFYTVSGYASLYGSNEEPGMLDLVSEMEARLPNLNWSQADATVFGWTEAIFAESVLRQAADNGDMTRAGVLNAGSEVEVDFQGLSPDQQWFGTPNDFVVRDSYFYDVVLADATTTTPITEAGSSGLTQLVGPYVGSVAEGYDFTGPCFGPLG